MTLPDAATPPTHAVPAPPSWFVAGGYAGWHCVRAWAPAEALMDHFLALCTRLAPSAVGADSALVDVVLHDRRGRRQWQGALLPLDAVCDALGRVRLQVAALGGVEISVTTADDQLVITPELLLVIYARTDRWPFLLAERGLHEVAAVPAPRWRAWDAPRVASPLLTQSLETAASRLGLVECTPAAP